MILADRILDCLRANGPIANRDLANWFRDIERMELDAEVLRLLRKNSISFSFNQYAVVEQKANGVHKPFVSQAVGEPVSQLGCNRDTVPITRERFECPGCHLPRFDAEFRHSALGKRFKVCKYCDSKRMQDARLKGPEGECPQAPLPAQGTTSKSVVSEPQGSAGESLPSNSVCDSSGVESGHADVAGVSGSESGGSGESPFGQRQPTILTDQTLCQPPSGSNAPPAVSSKSPEKRGNNRDVSADRCCDAASVPETSGSYSRSDPREDVRTPAGDSIAFPRNDSGRTDELLERVAGKLAQLRAMRVEIDCEIEDLVQLDALYRKVMGHG